MILVLIPVVIVVLVRYSLIVLIQFIILVMVFLKPDYNPVSGPGSYLAYGHASGLIPGF